MKKIQISNLTEDVFPELKKFCDQFIGQNYYSLDQLKEVLDKSCLNGQNCSFILFVDGEIKGIRLSYMPGRWSKMKGQGGLTPSKWEKLSFKNMGYFQSLFLHPDVMGKGWAPVLANLSMDEMKKAGAKGVLTHSWLESPNNSSRRYLEKIGFKLVEDHPLYWNKVDYECPRCGRPCVCTASEMLKVL